MRQRWRVSWGRASPEHACCGLGRAKPTIGTSRIARLTSHTPLQFIAVGPNGTFQLNRLGMPRPSITVLAATVAAILGCGAGGITQRPAGSLPTYDGHAARLFDDTIEPRAMGYELDRTP